MRRLILFAFLMLAAVPAVPAFAGNLYVRDGASGSTCADWGANACDSLSTAVALASRATDDVIYVADGSYAATTLDTATSSTHVITIKKATVADHGTSTGWSDSYGDGTMAFPNIVVSSDYWTFDGATGGGPTTPTSGFGCEFSANAGDDISFFVTTVPVTGLTIRHCSFVGVGNVDAGPANHFINVLKPSGGTFGGALFEYNYIDNISGLPFFMRFGDNNIIQYNYIGHVCGISIFDEPEHCEVLVMHGMNDMEFRYNYIDEAPSSGAFVHNTGDDGFPYDSYRIHIYGNVFRLAYGEGGIVCNAITGHGTATCGDWRIFNNTVAMRSQQTKRFFETEGPTTGTLIYNNIIDGYMGAFYLYQIASSVHDYTLLSNFGTGTYASGTAACTLPLYTNENGWTGHAAGACDDVTTTGTGIDTDIFLNHAGSVPKDFRLRAHVSTAKKDNSPMDAAGIDVCAVMDVTCDATQTYNTDMLGRTRGGAGETYDRGAFQFFLNCGTPSKAVFTSQPVSSVFGQSIGDVVATIQDSDGNTCGQSTDNVVLSKNGSATWGALATTSSLTKAAVAGVATWAFPDLSVTTTAGSGPIDAAVSGLTGATSNSFNIAASVISIIQQSGDNAKCSSNGTGVGSTASVTIDATGANAIVGALFNYNASSIETATVSDGVSAYSYGATYGVAGSAQITPFYKLGVSSGSLTLTSSSLGYPAICVMTLANVATVSAYDQAIASYSTIPISTVTIGEITPSESNEIVISVFGAVSSTQDTVDSGFTVDDWSQTVSGMALSGAIADRFQPAPYAIGATWNADTLFYLNGAIFSLKSGETPPPPSGGNGGGALGRLRMRIR